MDVVALAVELDARSAEELAQMLSQLSRIASDLADQARLLDTIVSDVPSEQVRTATRTARTAMTGAADTLAAVAAQVRP
ncbi:MAG: hypothetical protein ACFCVF_15735 [Kineosporiaceae bacterium]